MSNDTLGRPSTPALLADAIAKMTALFEAEMRLLRVEIGEKISTATHALVAVVVAAVLLLAALVLLLIGLVNTLVAFGLLQPWQAYLVVGAVIALFGGLSLYLATRSLSSDRLMPKRTMSQLGKDVEIVKEQVR